MDIFNKNNNTSQKVDMIASQERVVDDFLKSITKLISNVVIKVKMISNFTSAQKDVIVFLRPIDFTDLRQRATDQFDDFFNVNCQEKSLDDLRVYIDEINVLSSDQQLLKDFKTAEIIIELWNEFFESALCLSVDGQSISCVKVDDTLMIDVLTSDASAQYLVNLSSKL